MIHTTPPPRLFVDYYLAARVSSAGVFLGWRRIPCNGKCHTIRLGGSKVVVRYGQAK